MEKFAVFVSTALELEFYIRILYIERGLLQLPFNHKEKQGKHNNKQTNKQKTCRLAAVSMMRFTSNLFIFNVTKMEDVTIVTCSPYCEQAPPLMSVWRWGTREGRKSLVCRLVCRLITKIKGTSLTFHSK